jgi:hypothetical protein
MKKIFLLTLLFFSPLIYSQGNLIISYDTTGQYDDSIFIDLGLDASLIQSDYEAGNESRAIAFEMHGTWTNDSLQVYAASHPDSTYYPVYQAGSLVYEVATTGNSFIALKPIIYAGIRYLMFKLPANEAANRLYGIIRRQY